MSEPATTHRITGDDIISELIRNVDSGAFKVRFTTLVPCVFNVYLHAEDYDQVAPITDFIRTEAISALNEHLASLNKPSSGPSITRWLGVGKEQRPMEYKILEKNWAIEFHRDDEERLRPGDIEIFSELGSTQRDDLGAGAKTTFITRRAAEEPREAPPAVATSAGPPDYNPQATTDRMVRGHLRYHDASGDKSFAITRDQTVIGRGGKAFWVDLKIDGPADVSREHCRIRRDGASGTFFINDLSQYGTMVNGAAIPSSLERTATGEKIDRNVESPLPERATISLAGVFTLEFEAARDE